jgi:hypothetical protein
VESHTFQTSAIHTRSTGILDFSCNSPAFSFSHWLLQHKFASRRNEIIYILNDEGTAIASAIIDAPLPTGFNYSFRPFFQSAMEGKADIYPALGVVSGKRGIHLSTPVYGLSKKAPIGVLILKIDIAEVENMIKHNEQKNSNALSGRDSFCQQSIRLVV